MWYNENIDFTANYRHIDNDILHVFFYWILSNENVDFNAKCRHIDNYILHVFFIGFCTMKMLISMLNVDTLTMIFYICFLLDSVQ